MERQGDSRLSLFSKRPSNLWASRLGRRVSPKPPSRTGCTDRKRGSNRAANRGKKRRTVVQSVPQTIGGSGINLLKTTGNTVESLKFGTVWPMVWDMEDRFYYSTGKAAQELAASQDTIRALCNSGAVRAVPTNGGQWRVPAREVERLKREGLPPVPRRMPGDGSVTRNVSTRRRMNGDQDDDADPHRAAGREPEVVQAYAGAARKHALIEEREADCGWRNWRTASVRVNMKCRPGTGNASPKCNTRVGCVP